MNDNGWKIDEHGKRYRETAPGHREYEMTVTVSGGLEVPVSQLEDYHRRQKEAEEKRRAAKLAATLVEPDQTLFFDCGTTTPWIIEAIDNEIPFTAVCYSLNTFLALKEKPHCRAFLCGGEFHASNAIFKPIDFQQTLNNFCPDIAFYSAAGVHVSKGATCFNLEELPVKHWAMSMAQKHVLVVDHSKFGKVRPARMGDLKRFDIVVSDCCPEDEYVKYAQTHRIKLMY